MQIQSLKWLDPNYTRLLIVTADGQHHFCPWPSTAWFAERVEEAIAGGMQVAECDPPPAPIDPSDADNLERAVKALGLVCATWAGKTPAQLKAAFKQAWDSLA